MPRDLPSKADDKIIRTLCLSCGALTARIILSSAFASNLSTPTIPPSLAHHSITLAEWSTTYPKFAKLIIGALIFRRSAPSHPPQILLVKRASTDSYPNFWETPGGSVDASDKTLLDAVVREVWEETGLRVKKFVQQVWDANEGAIDVKFWW
ncbi:hypothetical protein V500_02751, partial [Pseudogymnoascus sp. VKM F-4518 (FW-2643)]